jgi:hypothetical protein
LVEAIAEALPAVTPKDVEGWFNNRVGIGRRLNAC